MGYPVAYRKYGHSTSLGGSQGRGVWTPSQPANAGSSVVKDIINYDRARVIRDNYNARVWRSLVKPAVGRAGRRAIAAAAIRGAAKFVPYVGAAVTAAEILWMLYNLWYEWHACGVPSGYIGDRGINCVGRVIRHTIPDDATPPESWTLTGNETAVAYYTWLQWFNGTNQYAEWISLGGANLPKKVKDMDRPHHLWEPEPQPEPHIDDGVFPWEKTDPFYRSPFDPPAPWHPPYRWQPRRRGNPYRNPTEQSQRGNHDPRTNPAPDGWPQGWPFPDPAAEPDVIVLPQPDGPPIVVPHPRPKPRPRPRPDPKPDPDTGGPSPKPRPKPDPDTGPSPEIRFDQSRHQKRPPGARTKERKAKGDVPGWLLRGVNTFTEMTEVVDSAWDAMPCRWRQGIWAKGGRAGTRFLTPDEKLALIYKNSNLLDIDQFIENLGRNLLEDMVIGGLSNLENKGRGNLFDKYGLDTPYGNMTKIDHARKGLEDILKRIRKEKGTNPCNR